MEEIKIFIEKYFTLSNIADIIGITGGVVYFLIWIRVGRFKKELEKQKDEYKKKRKAIQKELISLRDTIFKDGYRNENVISDLRIKLHELKKKFDKIYSSGEVKCIKELITLSETRYDEINFHQLHIHFDRLIGYFA